jgi:uncharacterized repeat protein (TIGR03803 family)
VTGTGNFSKAVTWSVSPSSIGAVSSAGIFTPAATGTATVKATSTQDTSQFGTATVTVNPVPSPTTAMIVPSILQAGQQTQVTVTCFVTGADSATQVQLFNLASGTPVLIGTMTDDGQNGDQTAGDQVYTIVTNLTPPAASSLPLQVVATTGPAGIESANFTVQLVQIPSFTSNSDVNQAESQIYSTAIQTRTNFSSPDWSSSALLPTMSGNLVSIYGQFSGVVNQNASLQSSAIVVKRVAGASPQSNSPHADGILGSILNVLTFGLLSPAQNASSCNQLLQSLGGFRGDATVPVLSLDDPGLQQFAQELATTCTIASSCQGAFGVNDFLSGNLAAAVWAQEYIVSGQPLPTSIDGCGGGVAQSVDNVAVTSEVGQFTDLAGDGLTSLAGGGQISQQLTGYANDVLVGTAVDSSGSSTLVIGQVGANQTLPAPTGTYNLAASFGGDTANATITNTPVYPNSITNISPLPGVILWLDPPEIKSFSPTSGPVGTPVTLSGYGFNPPSGSLKSINFNGVNATVSSATDSSMTVVVPPGATKGPITVITTVGETMSSISFTVTATPGNPVPTITGLNPPSLTAGATPQTLAVYGTGFLPSSTVTFNGASHAATFISATQLTISLTLADLATIGTYPVVVVNPAPGGGQSTPATFTVNSSGVSISPSAPNVPLAGAQTFTATVMGGSKGVTWSIEEGAAGGTLISSNTTGAVYSPPSSTGTFHLKATSIDNSLEAAVANISVVTAIAPTVLYSFTGTNLFTKGESPNNLIQGSDGNFYSTTSGGGNYEWGGGIADCYNSGCGSVFKMDSLGNLTVLHLFTKTDGAQPQAGVVQGIDDYLYGTTPFGGVNLICAYGGAIACGNAFRVDTNGNYTVLHEFTVSDGVYPEGNLLQAKDGYFYGTTTRGGNLACDSTNSTVTSGCGTLFRMDTSGNVTVLHSFSGTDGAQPLAGLIQGSDGNLYGTASQGGASGDGTIFKSDTSGNVTVLHSFSGADGKIPSTSLVQASDGYFYGTTSNGGANSPDGVAFRIDSLGNFTLLHSFSGVDGANGVNSLIQANDGMFYGTSPLGGAGTWGTIFRMDSSGNVTVLHSFAGPEGKRPYAGLIQGSDGFLYGSATGGGTDNGGVIYRLP